ncbi:hypothetical protein [Streptomyces sp. V1I1]|uniref:hypothetical protein n=1 Tax=Streptomyces sp. V1I1 TaxID=3042272 RepID=UPI0027883550|nr:hypothetical protein [Streptomyces sp. V1I1]MDQ0940080.1 hypothetical protein [Streptomyces sp. V1I1]
MPRLSCPAVPAHTGRRLPLQCDRRLHDPNYCPAAAWFTVDCEFHDYDGHLFSARNVRTRVSGFQAREGTASIPRDRKAGDRSVATGYVHFSPQ